MVRLGRGRADIMIGPAVIQFKMTKPGFYIELFTGLNSPCRGIPILLLATKATAAKINLRSR